MTSKNQCIKWTLLIVSVFFIFQSYNGIAQDCNCTEYIFLNETSNGGKVHKYSVAADGTLTQIFNGGDAWYPGGTISELPSPHGLTTDINGNVYIGETGDIRKLTCEGEIFSESDFVINDDGFNFGSVGNSLYTNTTSDRANPDELINEYDLCTGELTNTLCLNVDFSGQSDWGFFIDPNTNIMYSTSQSDLSAPANAGRNAVFQYTQADFGSASCVEPFIAGGDNIVNIGDNELPHGELRGITTDLDGNIYVVMQEIFSGVTGVVRAGRLLKYDPNGAFLAATPWDTTDSTTDLDGLFFALGIVYSETTGTFFISRGDQFSNCIQQYDTNLNDLGGAVPPAATGDVAKGIAIKTECCPNNAITTVDTIFCDRNIGEQLFLKDFIDCDGTICEGGIFVADPANDSTIFDSCNNTIEITGQGCSTFTKGTDGMASASQCSAFMITINICVDITPAAPAISVTDNTCNPDVAGSINVDTACPAGSTLEFSIDGGNTWSTTQPQYDANPVTLRARCLSEFGCISAETADLTTAPQLCCPPENCINQFGAFTITKRRP